MSGNPYAFTGPGSRWTEEQPTAKNLMDIAREGLDHDNHALNILMDTDDADGLYCSIAAPMKVEVSDGVIWSCGWWQAGDGRWFWLWKASDVASFTRAQADFYIPWGPIGDVPTS